MEKLRKCLKCKRMFRSTGPGNRICKSCKKHNRQLYGGLEAPAINEADIKRFIESRTSSGTKIRQS